MNALTRHQRSYRDLNARSFFSVCRDWIGWIAIVGWTLWLLYGAIEGRVS